MDGIKIEVIGNIANVVESPYRITSGTVGLPIEFSFDEQWDGLQKTAVFRVRNDVKIVEDLEAETTVPWELLQKPGAKLSVGVYGVNQDGSIAIPTIWANVRTIKDGVDPEGDPSAEPTLPVWQRLWNAIGNLVGLKTNAKDNLVDAINEVHNIALSGGIESDPTLSVSGKAADAKATGDLIQSHTDDKNNPHGVTIAKIGAAPAGWGFGEDLLHDESRKIMEISGESLDTFKEKINTILATMANYTAKLVIVRAPTTVAGDPYTRCGNGLGILYRGNGAKEAVLMSLSYQSWTRGCNWRIQKYNDTWSGFMWENPPMYAGVEYLTTERFLDKPVYTKLVSFGALPKASQGTAPHGISSIDKAIRWCARAGGSSMVLTNWSAVTDFGVDATKIYITTGSDVSWVTADIQIWYLKP